MKFLFPLKLQKPKYDELGFVFVIQIVIGWIIPSVFLLSLFLKSFIIIHTSEVGIKSRFGVIDNKILLEGFNFKVPFVDEVERVSIKQLQNTGKISIQTKDFQTVNIDYQVMYSVPAKYVINNKKTINGDVFEIIIAKRADESFRNTISHYSAIDVVQNRTQIVEEINKEVTKKIEGIAQIDNILLLSHTFNADFQAKVDEKMRATQEAETARVNKQKTQFEADAEIIKAKGKAEAMRIEAIALNNNPKLIELRQVEVNMAMIKAWDGHSPHTVMVNDKNTSVILPIK
jgi:regulator of protease activity HflC (stomatin/prohibitin superfamily)